MQFVIMLGFRAAETLTLDIPSQNSVKLAAHFWLDSVKRDAFRNEWVVRWFHAGKSTGLYYCLSVNYRKVGYRWFFRLRASINLKSICIISWSVDKWLATDQNLSKEVLYFHIAYWYWQKRTKLKRPLKSLNKFDVFIVQIILSDCCQSAFHLLLQDITVQNYVTCLYTMSK